MRCYYFDSSVLYTSCQGILLFPTTVSQTPRLHAAIYISNSSPPYPVQYNTTNNDNR